MGVANFPVGEQTARKMRLKEFNIPIEKVKKPRELRKSRGEGPSGCGFL